LNSEKIKNIFPEIAVGGFTSIDGTMEFYRRIDSLIDGQSRVLDFGAGRGAWYLEDPCLYRRSFRDLRGRVASLVGCDIDPSVLENEMLDQAVLLKDSETLPFDDSSFDIIVCDFTFEHISDPTHIAVEFLRILKPGGWLCARTPNKYSYTSVITRLIMNTHHKTVLRFAQPDRKPVDVFPTRFVLNSISDIVRSFPAADFENCTYRYESEPAYYFNNRFVLRAMVILNNLLPVFCKTTLMVFLRKRGERLAT
jgi:SAM-dependent methyltransferase